MIDCICASPRTNESTSFSLLDSLEGEKRIHFLPLACETEEFGDTAVIAYPLYFDSLPALLLSELEKLPKSCRLIYALCNCGFFEGRQTLPSLLILENFCQKTGRVFGGGMGIGAGALFHMLERLPPLLHPHGAARRDFALFSKYVENKKQFGIRFYDPRIPKRLYILCAHSFFRLRAKRLRL